MIKVYIIGSLSQESQIKKFAKKLSSIGNDVKYIFNQPDSGWTDEELAMVGVINDYNYMLSR